MLWAQPKKKKKKSKTPYTVRWNFFFKEVKIGNGSNYFLEIETGSSRGGAVVNESD